MTTARVALAEVDQSCTPWYAQQASRRASWSPWKTNVREQEALMSTWVYEQASYDANIMFSVMLQAVS